MAVVSTQSKPKGSGNRSNHRSGVSWYTEGHYKHRYRRLFGEYAHWSLEDQQDLGQEIALEWWLYCQEHPGALAEGIWHHALPHLVLRVGRRLRSEQRRHQHEPLPDDLSESPDLEVNAALSELTDIVREVSTGMTGRELRVLDLRFGLNGVLPLTLHEAGAAWGVTGMRIRQIEAKALGKLRRRPRVRPLRNWLYPDGIEDLCRRLPTAKALQRHLDDLIRTGWGAMLRDTLQQPRLVCPCCHWRIRPHDGVLFTHSGTPRDNPRVEVWHSRCYLSGATIPE